MTHEISLSTAGLIESADKSLRLCRQKAEIPFWAVPLPLPPEYDFLADVEADRRLAAVMCATARIAKQRGETFASQVEIWKGVIK